MVFEWDARKSATNKAKHGLCFEEVELALAEHGMIASFQNPKKPGQHVVVFRSLDDKICSVAVESRGEKIRLISAHEDRRMRKRYGP